MLVRQLMQSEVVTLDAGSTLDVADDLMRVDRVRHLPVVSRGKLVGIVSHRDLLRAAVSNALSAGSGSGSDWLRRISVDDVMIKEVLTAHPEAAVGSAVDMMLSQRIGCLPVVEDGKLVGLLSETDCLRHLSRVLHADEERRSLA